MRIIWFLTITLLITSCNKVKYVSKPDIFIEKDQMAAIMTDIFLLDGTFSIDQMAYLKTGVVPHDFVYNKHNIDSTTFSQNFKYYTDRPEILEEILKLTQERLEFNRNELKEQIEIDKKEKAETPTIDPLKETAPDVLLPTDVITPETNQQTGQ